ncbi:MAG: glycoside hydrolase family 78 protein, partial [Akkermansiaceae bacterium]|nr:glycoside hydrolase family 78 protein [Akkermansiaceae bacterium]
GWKLIDTQYTRGQKQTAWQVVVIGEDDARVLWDSGRVESEESVNNSYAGESLRANQAARWKVRVWDKDGEPGAWSATARFSMGLLEPTDWQGEWIRLAGADEVKHIWYRKTFKLENTPRQAFAHLASIGYHELYVNGRRVDDRVLAPAVTNLQRRVLYVTYDLAPFLKAGRNVIAVWTGPGWARADGSYGKGVWKQDAILRCQVNMIGGPSLHSDGSWKCRVSSSESLGLWKGGGQGEYGGELVDARAHVTGWNEADFDDSGWSHATICQKDAILSAHLLEPDRKLETLRPVSMREADGCHTFDMGRNFTGWIEFRLRHGREGQVVRFTTANREGPLVEFNQESRYIHDAGGVGTFSHRFNYTAGRWITVHGLGYMPEPGDLTCHIISNDRVRTGHFECSKPLFNEIYETDLRTYLACSINGVTMDCPHRERFGYGEVALACSWGCAIPHFDSTAYYRKVAQDWFDVQREDGFVNTIAPQTYKGAGGTLWSSAPVTMSWEFYKAYGDRRQLEAAYEPMKRWVDFLGRSVSEDGVLVAYENAARFLGDWATPHGSEYGNTPEARLFNNCVYAYNLMVLVEAAGTLGRQDDATTYQKRLEDLRRNAHRHFYDAGNKRYIDGRQLAMAFPLYVGITPEGEPDAVYAGFVEEISTRKPYLDTGSSGLPMLLKYLVEDAGRADLIHRCLDRNEVPGYGYFLRRGETTWPEYWKIDGEDSRIHTCYTGIAGYFTKAIGGILPDPDRYGMKQFLIKPRLVGDLTHAHTTSGSYYGKMVSNWRRKGQTATFEIEVPPNTSAKVFLPAAAAEDIREDGQPVMQAPGVKHLGPAYGCQVFAIGSGRYVFTSNSVPAAE